MKSKKSRHESTSAESEVSEDSAPSMNESSDSEESMESSADLKRLKKKKKHFSSSASNSKDDDVHHRRSIKKRKHKKKKKKHSKKRRKESSEESESGEEPSSESEEEEQIEEEEPPAKRKNKRKHSHRRKHSKKGSVRSENNGKHKSRREERLSQDRHVESKYYPKESSTHEHHSVVQVENISSSEDEKVTASATHTRGQYYDDQHPKTLHREPESSRYRNYSRHRTESETQRSINRYRDSNTGDRLDYGRERERTREHSARYHQEQVDRYQHKYPERLDENEYVDPLPTNAYERASQYTQPEVGMYQNRDNNRDFRYRQYKYEAPKVQDIPRLLDVEIPQEVAYSARGRPQFNVDGMTDYKEDRHSRSQLHDVRKTDDRRADRPRSGDRSRHKPRSSESHRNDREQVHSIHKTLKQDSPRIRDAARPKSRSHRGNEQRSHRTSRPVPRMADTSRSSWPATREDPTIKGYHESCSPRPRRQAAEEGKRERDRSPTKNRNEKDSKNYEWGKKTENREKKPVADKEKPDFSLSGKLAEDTNKVNGVVLKYSEPDDSKQPKRKWRFYPFKGEQALPILYIHRQSAFLLGRDKLVADIPLDHPSISKQHAALQYRCVPFKREDGTTGKRIRPYIIDLESANGTFVNNKKIESRKYVELLERDVVKFGFSQREYVLLHENSKDDACDDDLNN